MSHKNSGNIVPDNFPINLIKALKYNIYDKITILYNVCIIPGYFPELLKISYIIPIFKGGNSNEIKNYRPISKITQLQKYLIISLLIN